MIEVRVLGPIEVDRDGRPVELTGQKRRALLAFLLIHANTVVSTDALIDALWGERPPSTAKTSLRNLIVHVRRVVGSESLEARVPGYRLRVDEEHVDSQRFGRLLATARSSPARERIELLEMALRLWRGTPFADVFLRVIRPGRGRTTRGASRRCTRRPVCGVARPGIPPRWRRVAPRAPWPGRGRDLAVGARRGVRRAPVAVPAAVSSPPAAGSCRSPRTHHGRV
jgi:DNA-binding winged helix-turn-helix (wHTH) protein